MDEESNESETRTNEPSPNVFKKELGLEYVEPVERKQGIIEKIKEKLGQAGDRSVSAARQAYSGYSRFQAWREEEAKKTYEKRQFNIKQHRQRISRLQLAKRETILQREAETGFRPRYRQPVYQPQKQYMQPSQRSEIGYIDFSLGGPRMEGEGKRIGPNLSVGPSQNLGSSVGRIGNSPFGGGTGPSFGVRKGKTKWL